MLISFGGISPLLAADVYVASGARLIGNLTIATGASVWFNAVIRADADRIEIGDKSNVQDNSTLHCDSGFPCLVGCGVTIGHNAIVHGGRLDQGIELLSKPYTREALARKTRHVLRNSPRGTASK